MTKGGNTGVQAQSVNKDILDVASFDRLEIAIKSALGDDDDGLAFANVALLMPDSAINIK